MQLRRIGSLVALVTLFLLLSAPAWGATLAPVTSLDITAHVQEDGSITVTERRLIREPRNVEFVELLLPETASIHLELSDQKGQYQLTTNDLKDRTYRTESSGPVVYVEWMDQNPGSTQEIVLSYELQGALVIHQDAVEWYWPAFTGSGGRAITQLDAAIHLPASEEAYLYAYGGRAGGVKVDAGEPLRVRATSIPFERSFEWRLIVPRSLLPEARGAAGDSTLQQLLTTEEARIEKEMSRAEGMWIAHWLLLFSPIPLWLVYRFTVRRFRPDPNPTSLFVSDLTAVAPATVGWAYDATWFDIACAHLCHLRREGSLRWHWEKRKLFLNRVPGAPLTEADEALLHLFWIDQEPINTRQVRERWKASLGTEAAQRRDQWLKKVEATVPPEWLQRPTAWWAVGAAAVYGIAGPIGHNLFEWISLWAVALVFLIMAWKRRCLSPLGESHVARWVSLYHKIANGKPQERIHVEPDIPPEYLLAVEVGDKPLAERMGDSDYAVIRRLYRHLEALAERM